MESKAGALLDKIITKSTCKHHWVIETPEKATSKGVCKLCGEVKIFDNVIEQFIPAKDKATELNLSDILESEDVR
jgi:hypothetical protein